MNNCHYIGHEQNQYTENHEGILKGVEEVEFCIKKYDKGGCEYCACYQHDDTHYIALILAF